MLTLLDDIIKPRYNDEMKSGEILLSTLVLRSELIKITSRIGTDKPIIIREFDNNPLSSLKTIKSSEVIINQGFSLEKITKNIYSLPLMVEALDFNNVSSASWDDYIETLYNFSNNSDSNKIETLVINDVFKTFDEIRNDNILKEKIKRYNSEKNIVFDSSKFWYQSTQYIIEKYWEKFSFAITINDYDIYYGDKTIKLSIEEELLNNGFLNEIIIKINYLSWVDNFKTLFDWISSLNDVLVSFRFETIFDNKNRLKYYEQEADKHNLKNDYNSIEEEANLIINKVPILKDLIVSNDYSYALDFIGGYFGNEGFIKTEFEEKDDFELYKNLACKFMNSVSYDLGHINFTLNTINGKESYVCCTKKDY